MTDPYAFAKDPKNIPDENWQMLSDTEWIPEGCSSWKKYDLWTLWQACRILTLGFPLDLVRERKIVEEEHPPLGSVKELNDRESQEKKQRFSEAHLELNSMERVVHNAEMLAKLSVGAGKIRDPDTPKNWIKWAKLKGYKTDLIESLMAPSRLPGANSLAHSKSGPTKRDQLFARLIEHVVEKGELQRTPVPFNSREIIRVFNKRFKKCQVPDKSCGSFISRKIKPILKFELVFSPDSSGSGTKIIEDIIKKFPFNPNT